MAFVHGKRFTLCGIGSCSLRPTEVVIDSIGEVYQYSVTYSGYTGDIVGEFVASCKKYDVQPGFYYRCGGQQMFSISVLSLVQNCYLNVWGGLVQNNSLHENQVSVTQAEYESIALAQVLAFMYSILLQSCLRYGASMGI